MSQPFSKVLVLVILIVLVAGGFFAWQYFGAPKEGVKDETANWKIFRDEYQRLKTKFEMKYPPGWFSTIYHGGVAISTVEPGKEEWWPLGTLPAGEAVVWFDETGFQTIDDLINERLGPATNNIILSDLIKDLNGLSGREVIYTCKNCEAEYIPDIDKSLSGTEGKVIFFSKNSDIFYIWLYYYKNDRKADYYIDIFNQMLSTFRFWE